MNDALTIVPSKSADWLPLARSQSGRLFKKHILSKGQLLHPKTGEPIDIDDAYMDRMVDNFNAGVCDIVQVPLAGPKNEHTEAPDRNIGEVVSLDHEGDKLYATIDVRDDTAVPKMGKTILGASALLSQNYTDTRTGRKVGPALLHVCATNRPYVLGLEDYEELVAATSDNSGDVVVLSAVEGTPMDRDELIAELRKHGIDVNELLDEVEAARPSVALTQQLATALVDGDVVSLSAGQEMTVEDVKNGVLALAYENAELGETVVKAADQITALTNELDKVYEEKAEVMVDGLIDEGRIAPAKRETFISLAMNDYDTFENVVPEEPVVSLSAEKGTSETDNAHLRGNKSIEAEIERYANSDAAKPYVRADG